MFDPMSRASFEYAQRMWRELAAAIACECHTAPAMALLADTANVPSPAARVSREHVVYA